MHPIATRALLMALAVFAASTRIAPADEPKGDLLKLQGSWTAKVGPEKNIPVTLTIKGNAMDLVGTRPDGEEFKIKGEIKLDEKAEIKTLDWVNFTGPDGQEIPDNHSIYKIDGDKWTICSGGFGNERPSKFEAGDGGPPMLNTFVRVKENEKTEPFKSDLDKFQGIWLAPAGPNDEVMITMTVKDKTYVATYDKGDGSQVEIKGEIKLDEKATPRTLDFIKSQRNDGDDARDNLGIYDFDGDKIKVCVGGAGNERPKEFKKGSDGSPLLLIFTKKK